MKKLSPNVFAGTALAMLMASTGSMAAASPAMPAGARLAATNAPAGTVLLAQTQSETPTVNPEEVLKKKHKEAQEAEPKAEPEAEKPAEKAAEPAAEKPAEKAPEPAAEKPAEKAPEPAAEKPAEKAAEKPAEKAAEPAAEKPAEKAAEPAAEKPAKKKAEPEAAPAEKKAEPEAVKPAEPEAAKPAEKPAEPEVVKPAEKPAEPEAAKPAEKAAEPEAVKPAEKPAEQQAEPAAPVTPGAKPETTEGQPAVIPGTTGETTLGQPAENMAPVLDSQKRQKRKDGKMEAQPAQPTQPPVEAGPPPKSDSAAQSEAIRTEKVEPVTAEKGKRVEGERPRAERREGMEVLREIGNRVIFEMNNQVIVQSQDRPRIERDAKEVYFEDLPRGRTRETVVRPNGTQVVTIRDRYGDIIQRSRITPDGREYVLVYSGEESSGRDERGHWRDPGLDLPPLVLSIPANQYILDAEGVNDEEAYYDFLEQPPVEKVQRLYSIDDVKRSARVRDTVRRVDLDTITFEFGSAAIPETEVQRLQGVADAMQRLLKKNPAETFLIEGHTDAVGSEYANLALSDERAEAVAAALTKVFDIPPENLTTQGYGEEFLKVATDKPERENRRVAIRRITPLVAPVAAK